jgi:hypothetical protein
MSIDGSFQVEVLFSRVLAPLVSNYLDQRRDPYPGSHLRSDFAMKLLITLRRDLVPRWVNAKRRIPV